MDRFYVNGASGGIAVSNQYPSTLTDETKIVPTLPFKLPHITRGFFRSGTLVNRSVQECWNELSGVDCRIGYDTSSSLR